MGLSSLKRKVKGTESISVCSIEAFINDADAYAAGFPQIVGIKNNAITDRRKLNREIEMKLADPTGPEFKHSTFTLTVETIETLSRLAIRDQFNKSKLVRILIEHHMSLSKVERVNIYKTSKTI